MSAFGLGQYRVLCFAAMLVGVSVVYVTGNDGVSPVNSKAEAGDRASLYTGFRERASEDNIQMVTLHDTTTPFLNAFTDGEAIWRVVYEDVLLVSTGDSTKDGSLHRDFEVFIDSANGHLLKIVCTHGQLDPTDDPELSAASAEQQIRRKGELYLSIPDDPPGVDFATAALACPHDLHRAKQMVAQYILFRHEFIDSETSTVNATGPRPVWVISLRGVPPIEPKGYALPEWYPIYTRNRIRQVVNAITGLIRHTSTLPHVPLTPEDRARIFGTEKQQRE